MSFCKSVTKVETVGTVDIMLVVVDDVEAYWFYDYTKALDFVNKEVIVTYRDDFYQNRKVTAINTLAVPNIINVIDKHTNIRLYSDAEDNQSNISFNEIEVGKHRDGCTFYCCEQKSRSSASADWIELTIRDRLFRTAKLRVFDPENDNSYEGKYCIATLSKTKYGLQTDLISARTGDIAPNPEITIAREYINQFFTDDVEAMTFMANTNLIACMDDYMDYEKGFCLVRLATELCLCEQFYNVAKNIDVRTLTHAILASYGYCTSPNLPLSKETRSVMTATRSKWSKLQLMLSIIDPGNIENEPLERDLYRRVKSMADCIIDSRKTYRE